MRTSLEGIAQKAKAQPEYRFRNLAAMLDEEFLTESWRDIKKNAAYGVDKVSAADYEENLAENIRALVERLKRGGYHARLVKRQYIPKGAGKVRPLGIPVIEDKLLQRAVTRILEAIYEQDFLRCSYGYRPNVGALDAVDKLTVKLQFGQYNFVVEADIQSYFDNLDHEWLIRMLEERIDDQRLLQLIQKWLKAGVLDTDGQVLYPTVGTPQGGVISPILANVYLHYALDVWFHQVVRPSCKGEACLIRYADDFVAAFEKQSEAERFYKALGQRLGKFGLKLAADKTRIIPFDRTQSQSGFDFLGFEFRWGKDRAGKPHLERRTAPKKLRKSIQSFTEWSRQNRNLRLPNLFRQLNAKLRGYYNYYGIYGNGRSLHRFFQHVTEILYKWLNRRSQRHSFNWDSFKQLLDRFKIERPHIRKRPKTQPATGWA